MVFFASPSASPSCSLNADVQHSPRSIFYDMAQPNAAAYTVPLTRGGLSILDIQASSRETLSYNVDTTGRHISKSSTSSLCSSEFHSDPSNLHDTLNSTSLRHEGLPFASIFGDGSISCTIGRGSRDRDPIALETLQLSTPTLESPDPSSSDLNKTHETRFHGLASPRMVQSSLYGRLIDRKMPESSDNIANESETAPSENLDNESIAMGIDRAYKDHEDGAKSTDHTRITIAEEPFSHSDQEFDPFDQATHLAQVKYHFRPIPRTTPVGCTSWTDRDQSGDYNPDRDHDLSVVPVRKRARAAKGASRELDCGASLKKPKVASWHAGRWAGSSYVVTLRLKSEKARGVAATIAAETRWPEDAWNFLDSDHTMKGTRASFDEETQHRSARSKVRNQTAISRFLIEEDGDIVDLTGHPAARGCKECRKVGQKCPLLDAEEPYPCHHCAEENIDCDLVVPPLMKQACETCKQRRRKCSYAAYDGSDHSQPCLACQDVGYPCVAGPAVPLMWARMNESGKSTYVADKGQQKQLNEYNNHSSARKGGIMHTRVSASPLRHKRNEVGHQILALRQTTNVAISEPVQKHADSRPRIPKIAGSIATIKTSLAHPVQFMCQQDRRCTWCILNPLYGLMGYGKSRIVKVLRWANGQGYSELDNGYTNDGIDSSRMCEPCTLMRRGICFCPGHEMQKLELRSGRLSINERLKSLASLANDHRFTSTKDPNAKCQQRAINTSREKTMQALTEWCAICPSQAQFYCKCVQDSAQKKNEVSKVISGCGLRLCSYCTQLLTRLFNGSLELMIEQLMHGGVPVEYYPRGLRPDFDFLRMQSPMMKQIEQHERRFQELEQQV